MPRQKSTPENNETERQVNNILQSLRGEHFRHARNVQGESVSSSSLSVYAHNQPTLPIDLIYPTPEATRPWVPGPNPPRSWQSVLPVVSRDSTVGDIADNTPTWRARALSLFLSSDLISTSTPVLAKTSRSIYPDPSPVPQLTLLCLQCIRATCPGSDLADLVPFVPPHLRRALVRYAAVHAPLSQIELDALCGGIGHVDTELVIVGPQIRRAHVPRRMDRTTEGVVIDDGDLDLCPAWDADTLYTPDDDPPALRSLAVLSCPLSATTLRVFPPTITNLALIRIPHRILLYQLPTICPFIVLLDLSYNTWLRVSDLLRGPPMLEQVEWAKLKGLKVLGLRECSVTPKMRLELNRSRLEAVTIVE